MSGNNRNCVAVDARLPQTPPTSTGQSALRFVLGAAIVFSLAQGLSHVLIATGALGQAAGYAVVQAVIFGVNFWLNRYWVFKANNVRIHGQLAKFAVTAGTFRGIDWGIFLVISKWTYLPLWLRVFVSMGAVFPVKFIAYRFLVFSNHSLDIDRA